jgi:hypothetical protein
MAATIRKTRQDEVRAKIKAGNLINRLEKHIGGEIVLETSQIKAIEILLDRSIPKLSSVELTGENGGAVKFEVTAPWLTKSVADRNKG